MADVTSHDAAAVDHHRVALASRAGWGTTAVVAAALVQSIYREPVGWGPAAVATGLAVLAAARPFDGLLTLAGVGPLAAIVLILAGTGNSSAHYPEALTLAFITGWSVRRTIEWRPLAVSPKLRATAIVLIAAAVASAVVQGAAMLAEQPSIGLPTFLFDVQREYLIDMNPIAAAMLFAEGVLLMLLAADMCADSPTRRDAVMRVMVVGAASAALLNVLRIVEVAVRTDAAAGQWIRLFATLRVNTQYGDWNAAGSYFAMLLFIAAGFIPTSGWLARGGVALIGLALWITGSRTAMAAAVLIVLVALTARVLGRSDKRARLFAGAATVLVAALAVSIWVWYPEGRNEEAGRAFSIRVELAKAALQMTATNPVFGVGLGRFYALSPRYTATPTQVGYAENAHNNFLQILAELGIPGLVLFVAVLVLALWRIRSSERLTPRDLGLVGGIGAFLLTCLGGHPLLVPEAAYPFWIVIGLAAAHGSGASANRRVRLNSAVFVAVVAATVPLRASNAVSQADMDGVSVGLSAWQHGPGDELYRWAGDRSTIFVPASARAVSLPLRHGSEGPETIDVRIFLDGQEANAVLLRAGDQWRNVLVELKPRGSRSYSRIDLEAGLPGSSTALGIQSTNEAGVLMVGRPTVYQER